MSNVNQNLKKISYCVIRNTERKSLLRITYELLYLFIKYNNSPFYYFSRYLFLKSTNSIKDYFPEKKLKAIQSTYMNPSYNHLLNNKYLFYFYCDKYGIKVPNIILHNAGKIFFYKNKITIASKRDDFIELMEKIFIPYTNDDPICIKKQIGPSFGTNILKINKNELRDTDFLYRLYDKLVSSEYIIEEATISYKKLDDLNPASENTLLINTFKDNENNTTVISAMLRMDECYKLQGNKVSNVQFIGINHETGKLKEVAYTPFTISKGFGYTKYSNNGTEFNGFLIPDFKEAKKLALNTAQIIPGNKLVEWSIAITKEGPVMLQGNTNYNTNAEITFGGYKKSNEFLRVLKESIYC